METCQCTIIEVGLMVDNLEVKYNNAQDVRDNIIYYFLR